MQLHLYRDYFTEILADLVCRQKYEPHEFPHVSELAKRQTNYAKRDANVVGFERAHQLAFRNGLGNPVFSEFDKSLNHSTVRQYAQNVFTRSNIVVVGSGVDHKSLLGYVHIHFDLEDSEPDRNKSTYYGGDERILSDAENSHCTIAFQGFPLGSKNYYASKVLQKVLGGEKHLKWGIEQCRLTGILRQLSLDSNISSFNVAYSDNGLFGVQINAPNNEMAHNVKSVMDALATLKQTITEEELTRAKNLAKMTLANIAQSRLDCMDYIGFRVNACMD